MAEYFLHKGSPTYLHADNADVMSIGQFMAQNLRQAQPPIAPQPKHTFEISEGESVEIEKIVAAEKKDGQLYYKVKWVKYTWEAGESIQHLPHLIDGYWREHFYQNINQAAIDTASLALVNENDYNRTKSVVVDSLQDTREAQKAAAAVAAAAAVNIVADSKIVTSSDQQQQQQQQQHQPQQQQPQPQPQVINGATAAAVASATLGENNDVILEFTMSHPGGKSLDHAYQNRIPQAGVPTEKKSRRTYPLERKYVCSVCQKAFDRNTSLTRHMLVHTREKPFKCQLCEKAFSQNAHLKRHILIHIGQKSYQCNKCGKMFIEKGGLARHEATHSTEKPWVCNQCGKSFVLNEYLQRHLFLHTGQKPYQCNDCGRLFADGSSWRAHKLTHNKEKKYKCHVCSKMLKCKRNFKKHVQAHSDEKEMKHKCDICDERFPNKKILKEHIRKGRKNHRCKICRKPLKTREKYMSHMATHDPSSPMYNPNIIIQTEGGDEDKDGAKSDLDDGEPSDEEDQNQKQHNVYSQGPQDYNHHGEYQAQVVERSDDDESQNRVEEEILDKILGGKENMDSENMTLVSHTAVGQIPGSAPPIFTTLILKSEGNEEITISNPTVDTAVLVTEEASAEMLHNSEVSNILHGTVTSNVLHTSEASILHNNQSTHILNSTEETDIMQSNTGSNILQGDETAGMLRNPEASNILRSRISSNVSNVLTIQSQIQSKFNVTIPTTFITNTPRTMPTTFSSTSRTVPTSNLDIGNTAANISMQIESVAQEIQSGEEAVQSISQVIHDNNIVGNVDVLTEQNTSNLVASEIMVGDSVVSADVAETIILITQNNDGTLSTTNVSQM